jgi:flagellar biosynthesis/type III secretory pathway protein FliH
MTMRGIFNDDRTEQEKAVDEAYDRGLTEGYTRACAEYDRRMRVQLDVLIAERESLMAQLRQSMHMLSGMISVQVPAPIVIDRSDYNDPRF